MTRRVVAAAGAGVAAVVLAAAVIVTPTSAQDPAPLTEQRAATCVSDAEGYCTVKHNLGVVPDHVLVTPRAAKGNKPFMVTEVRGSETASTFQVRAVYHDGKPRGGFTLHLFYEVRGNEAPPPPTTTTTTTTTTTPPVDPPVDPPDAGAVCGSEALTGPVDAPAGAVVVPPGNNGNLDLGSANTTYYFATGIHTLGSSEFDQIIPGAGSTYIGGPGAILSGQNLNRYAFTQKASNVTIKHLTVRNFVAPTDEGVVNHDSGDGWVVEHNTLTLNTGAAMMAGDDNVIRGNCVKNNGQYGLNAYQGRTGGPSNLLLENNEFDGNNTRGEPHVGCGCTGAIKFWSVDGATVRGNWMHGNHGVAFWLDNNNNNFLIENNLIEDNESFAVFVEQSYNSRITGNTIRRNAWMTGKEFAGRGDNFPIGAIYVSESGGDSRVPARYTKLEFDNNTFTDNWGGLALWENADRFCNSPNNTGSDCTLPMGGTTARNAECSQPGIASQPLYWDCRWRTKNVEIHHNTFALDPAKVPGYSATFSGVQAVFSNYGTSPDWSPYKARAIQDAIAFDQNNRWHDNAYVGPWRFVPWEPGNVKTWTEWRTEWGQDEGSTLN